MNACLNGGTCSLVPYPGNGFKCDCRNEFSGERCEVNLYLPLFFAHLYAEKACYTDKK